LIWVGRPSRVKGKGRNDIRQLRQREGTNPADKTVGTLRPVEKSAVQHSRTKKRGSLEHDPRIGRKGGRVEEKGVRFRRKSGGLPLSRKFRSDGNQGLCWNKENRKKLITSGAEKQASACQAPHEGENGISARRAAKRGKCAEKKKT